MGARGHEGGIDKNFAHSWFRYSGSAHPGFDRLNRRMGSRCSLISLAERCEATRKSKPKRDWNVFIWKRSGRRERGI